MMKLKKKIQLTKKPELTRLTRKTLDSSHETKITS